MKKILLLFLIFTSHTMVPAQTAEIAKYKSMFTINFLRYVGWPEEAKQGDFVIGVLRSNPIAKQLKENTVGKKFGYQNIVIKEFKNIEDISNCQILYVDGNVNYSKHAAAIALQLQNKNSLIITESSGSIQSGSMINFVIIDNKLKFEVSEQNAGKFGLKLSNALTSMNNAIKT